VERFEKRPSPEVVKEARERLDSAFNDANALFYGALDDHLKAAEAQIAA
jgi:hypothetical protein